MRIVVFISIVLTLFTLLGIYVFTRMEQAFPTSIMTSKLILVFYIFLLSSFFIGKFLENVSINILSEALIRIGAFAAGFFVYGILIIVFYDLLRGVNALIPFFPDFIIANYEISKLWIGILSIILIGGIMVFGFLKTLKPQIKPLKISIHKPKSSLVELNIVAVSDIHLGTMVNHKKAKRLVKMINDLRPDLVLIGGDIIDDNIQVVKHHQLLEHFQGIESKYGIYSCLGNHEYISRAHHDLDYFSENGIQMLKDTGLIIDGKFNIIGRDDIQGKSITGKARKNLEELCQNMDLQLPTILLDHQPYKLDQVSDLDVDFQFSGHTHNGQFWPFNYITGMIFEQDWGYIKKKNTHFYISSGYGTAVVPIRVGNHSEIVHIKLTNRG